MGQETLAVTLRGGSNADAQREGSHQCSDRKKYHVMPLQWQQTVRKDSAERER